MKTTPVRFLLVEDDDDHAKLIQIALRENHIINDVDRVVDGEQAIDHLKRTGRFANARRPDLVLLDLHLPKVDGHEVLSFIKQDENLRTIPVVILTSSDAESDRNRAYLESANSFLSKPMDFGKFHTMIRDLDLYWSVWNQPPPEKRHA